MTHPHPTYLAGTWQMTDGPRTGESWLLWRCDVDEPGCGIYRRESMSDKPTRTVKIKPDGPYTVGQIAKLFDVSGRTVHKWADLEMMKCYKLPASKDRRFTREAVMAFLEKYPDLPRPAMFVVDAGTV